jgi:putative ABC transport system permease protein
VRIRFGNGVAREFTVIGILNTKSSVVDQRAYVQYKELRQVLNLSKDEYSEIAITATAPQSVGYLAEYLSRAPENKKNEVKTLAEAIPSGVADVKVAFALIGNIVAVIAVLVGLITVFVIIFVNASSRRRYLGILKAQGIDPRALILSYVFQALFYTVIGIVLGVAILFGFLQQYFMSHPLSLPMADGKLLLGVPYLSVRVLVLIVSTIISAFIPAWLIIRQNTLNAILGR